MHACCCSDAIKDDNGFPAGLLLPSRGCLCFLADVGWVRPGGACETSNGTVTATGDAVDDNEDDDLWDDCVILLGFGFAAANQLLFQLFCCSPQPKQLSQR